LIPRHRHCASFNSQTTSAPSRGPSSWNHTQSPTWPHSALSSPPT